MTRRIASILALALWFAGSGADGASAADYTVVACHGNAPAYSAAFGNGAFARSTVGVASARDWCEGDWGLEAAGGGGTPWSGHGGYLEACAPPGTRFVAYSLRQMYDYRGSGYRGSIDTGSCGGYAPVDSAGLPASLGGPQDWVTRAGGLDARGLRLFMACDASPCSGDWALTRWKNVQITVRDDAGGPRIEGATGPADGDWVRGSQPVSFATEDSVGVKRVRIDADPGSDSARSVLDAYQPCDYARLVPCREGRFTPSATVDTTGMGNGAHVLRYSAQDSANQWTHSDRAIQVDNASPSVAIDRTAGSATRSVAWDVRDPHSGVDAASLRAEYSADGGATWRALTGHEWDEDAGELSATVPGHVPDGGLRVRLAGRDRAQPGGNVFVSAESEIAVATRPGPPAIVAPAGWLGSDSREVALTHPSPGIAGYSVTSDGTDPDETIDLAGADATYRVDELPEGTTTVKARAVSGAGLAGEAAEAVVRVDRTPPLPRLSGAGSPSVAHPGPVAVTLSATDARSGMGDGAHVAWNLDGMGWVSERGDEARIAVAGDGRHTLEYRAVDAARNASEVQTRTIVVDGRQPGAPEAGAGFSSVTTNPGTTFTAARRFGAPCPAAATLVASRDATLSAAAPSERSGTSASLAVGDGSESVVAFPLPAAKDCEVVSATLRLRGSSARPVEVRRASSSWDEGTVAWNTRPGVVGPAVTVATAAGPWTEWDVTGQVRGLYAHGDNGLYLRRPDSGGERVDFGSRESADPPELVVRFAP